MRGSIDKIGGLDFIFKLMDLVPSTDENSVRHYSNIVREKSELRKLINVSEAITKRCYASEDDVDDIIGSAEQGIINITQNRNTTDCLIYRFILMKVLKSLRSFQMQMRA